MWMKLLAKWSELQRSQHELWLQMNWITYSSRISLTPREVNSSIVNLKPSQLEYMTDFDFFNHTTLGFDIVKSALLTQICLWLEEIAIGKLSVVKLLIFHQSYFLSILKQSPMILAKYGFWYHAFSFRLVDTQKTLSASILQHLEL